MLGARGLQITVDLGDLALEAVDQIKTRVDGLAPRIGNLKALEQLAALNAEGVGDRTRPLIAPETAGSRCSHHRRAARGVRTRRDWARSNDHSDSSWKTYLPGPSGERMT